MTDTVSKLQRSRVMAKVKSQNTTPEKKVEALLKELKIRFGKQAKDLPGKPDFVFRKRQRAIWVQGCFWHRHDCGRCRIPSDNRAYWIAKIDRNAARDRKNLRAMRQMGWRVLVVWECQLKKADQEKLKRRVERFLCEVRPTRSLAGR